MKKNMYFLLKVIVLGVGLAMLFGCTTPTASSGSSDPTVTYGGWVYDISTGSVITDYKITLDTASASYNGSVNSTTGKFSLHAIPQSADYKVTVTATNYVTYCSTNGLIAATENNPLISSLLTLDQSYIGYIPIIPTTVQSAAISIDVMDKNTGAPITAGQYKLVRGAIGANATNVYNTGGNTPTIAWAQDADVVGGTFSNGSISIAAGALLYGYQYVVSVFGMSNYQDNNGMTIDPTTTTSTEQYTIQVTNIEDYNSTLTLVGNTSVDGAGNTTLLPASRQITLYFNQDITLSPDWDQSAPGTYKDGSSFVTGLATTDNDNDGNPNTLNGGEGNTSTTTWIAVAASGNQLTITLADYTTVAAGSILTAYDADDDLSFTITLNGINIRPANDTNANWDNIGVGGGVNLPTVTAVIKDSSAF